MTNKPVAARAPLNAQQPTVTYTTLECWWCGAKDNYYTNFPGMWDGYARGSKEWKHAVPTCTNCNKLTYAERAAKVA